MDFIVASVDSFIIKFSNTISLDLTKKINFYSQEINKFKNIIEVVPSYTTILVTFNILNSSFEDLILKIKKLDFEKDGLKSVSLKSKTIEIPTYYDIEVGLDLLRISKHKKIAIEDIIKIHTSQPYCVFAIGFAPGFAYLGEVNEKIAMKRLETPRKKIPKGSVGIADKQTAIYPQASPGGWNIIGKTTFEMFDKNIETLSPLNIGDNIQFKQISKSEFLDMGGLL